MIFLNAQNCRLWNVPIQHSFARCLFKFYDIPICFLSNYSRFINEHFFKSSLYDCKSWLNHSIYLYYIREWILLISIFIALIIVKNNILNHFWNIKFNYLYVFYTNKSDRKTSLSWFLAQSESVFFFKPSCDQHYKPWH